MDQPTDDQMHAMRLDTGVHCCKPNPDGLINDYIVFYHMWHCFVFMSTVAFYQLLFIFMV